MEFGKLEDLNGVDWTLPADDPKNTGRFHTPRRNKIRLGSPAWSCKKWRGKIYPEDSRPEDYLYHYSRHFDCIELNTTHYRIPELSTAKSWRQEVPETFKFCPKIYKGISHTPTGLADKSLLTDWLEFTYSLGENLGPSFIQFHENFSYADKYLLFKFLEAWPSEFKLSVELRHPSWFQKNKIIPALTDYLHRKGIGLVITDVAGRRDVLHTSVSAPWVLIRLIGNDLDPSDKERIHDWSQRLEEWKNNGVNETYLFLHQPEDDWTIEFARMAAEVFADKETADQSRFALEKPRDLFSI